MKNIIKVILLSGVIGTSLIGCVPARKHQDVVANLNAEKAKSQDLHSQNVNLESENKELVNKCINIISKKIK